MRGQSRRFGRAFLVTATVVATSAQMSALRTAAGGTSGTNGFADVSRFLDNLATYIIYLAIPAGALGLIAAGGMMIAAIGVGIVLLAKGIMA
jgi:hypothetical protein